MTHPPLDAPSPASDGLPGPVTAELAEDVRRAKSEGLDEPKKPSGVLIDAAVNIFLPSYVLMKLSDPSKLGEVNAFALAVAIPFAYGAYSALRDRKLNWIASLGLVNILAAGGLRFLEIGKLGFALKEMLMPLVLGVAVLFSLRTETPFVHRVLFNDKLVNVARIHERLAQSGRGRELDSLLTRTTLILAVSFFSSAALNFGLAWSLLESPVGTVEFNQEFGKMTALSWPIIVLPSMAIMAFALWHMASGLRRLTGLAWEEVLKVDEKSATGKGPDVKGTVKGKIIVAAVAAIIAGNIALFLWAREATPGCFLRKDEITARWGDALVPGTPGAPGTPEEAVMAFRASAPEERTRLARTLIDDHTLYGVPAQDVWARLGPSDGASPDKAMPAYRAGQEGWNVVFVIGDTAEKKNVVRDIVVWKGQCG